MDTTPSTVNISSYPTVQEQLISMALGTAYTVVCAGIVFGSLYAVGKIDEIKQKRKNAKTTPDTEK